MQECESEVSDAAKQACETLREALKDIVDEMRELKDPNRKHMNKLIDGLRIWSPRFKEKMHKALEDFKIKLSIESHKQSERAMDMLTKQMKELQITKTQLQRLRAPGIEATITTVQSRINELDEKIEKMKVHQDEIQQAISSLPHAAFHINESVRADGTETRELIRQLYTEGTDNLHQMLIQQHLSLVIIQVSVESARR